MKKKLILPAILVLVIFSANAQDLQKKTSNLLNYKQLTTDSSKNPTIACNVQDSLALVALYNSTTGASWTNNDFWLTDSVYKWHGITLSDAGRVIKIIMPSNNITGEIPADIGQLTYLQNLELKFNNISGSIPAEIGQLSNLETLILFFNHITAIPIEMYQLSNLQKIDLHANQITGEIPVEIAQLSNLQELKLGGNNITGSIPAEIGQLANLEILSIENNQITGVIPPEIGQLSNLQELYLSSCQFSGGIPPEIGQLTNLTDLFLSNSNLSGSIPPEIGQLTQVESLFLNDNNLSGSIPHEIGNMVSLGNNFNLSNNKLTGSIPKEIEQLDNLITLNLSNNEITGSIPPEIGQMNSLNSLYLSFNKLTDSIPTEICQAPSLQYIYLNNNLLSGSIPSEIGQMTNLHFLYLNNNHLTGSIPTEINQIEHLYRIYLNDNHLTGSVPPAMTNIDRFYINNNEISDLPDLSSYSISTFDVSNNKLTFEDLEPNISLNNFTYQPQDKVDVVGHYYPSIGQTVNLSTSVGGANNTYQWYKDNVIIPGANSGLYTINSYANSDAGIYYCEVENTTVTGLTLIRRNLYIGVDIPTYTISASAYPSSAEGAVTGAGTYNEGELKTLVATPNTGYHFANWEEGGDTIFAEPTYQFLVTADSSFTANFDINTYNISVSVSPIDTAGTISGAGTYTYGENVTLTASPNTGYHFINWTENGTEVSVDLTYQFTANADRDLIANFELDTYNISASVSPVSAGTVTGVGTYTYGDNVTLTASPNTDYNFVNWTENGTEVSTDLSYQFTATADRDLIANFESNIGISVTKNLINIYPNPVSEKLHIEIDQIQPNTSIKIFDYSGKLVLEQNTSNNKTFVNVSALKYGLYIIKIQNNLFFKSYKLIIKANKK